MLALIKEVYKNSFGLFIPLMKGSEGASFTSEVISSILDKRKTKLAVFYFDRWRYPDASPAPFDARKVFRFIRFLQKNADKINKVASLFDDRSRELFKTILTYRALGPVHIELPDSEKLLAIYEAENSLKTAESSKVFPPFKMANYSIKWEGEQLEYEGWLPYGLLSGQYYYNRNSIKIVPEEGDVVIDAGACFGDTTLAFAASVGPSGKVHSFEPLPRQFSILQENIEKNANLKDRIYLHQAGVGDRNMTLNFTDTGAGARASKKGLVQANIVSIDSLNLPKVDFIKMDIEGAEKSAIAGANNTIQRNKPKLALSIYHSTEDLFEIALMIKEIYPDYKLYLDHYTAHSEETILYGCI